MIKDLVPPRRNDDVDMKRASEGPQGDHSGQKLSDARPVFTEALAIVRAAMDRLAKLRANKDR